MPVVVITGASGFVGSYLVDHFRGQGWKVRGLVRSVPVRKQHGVRFFAYNLGETPPAEAFAGADYLIHAAYSEQGRHDPDALERNIRAAKQLLATSRKQQLKKNIFISSMSARKSALSVYGRQKYAIEQLFDTERDAVVRAGLVVGGGGLVKRMIEFMRSKHVVPLVGGGEQRLQIIAVQDLAQAFQTIIEHDFRGLFTVAHPQIYSYRELYTALARHSATKVLVVPVSYKVLQTGIRAVQALRLPLGITEDNLLGLKKARAVDTAADLAALGLTPLNLNAALTRNQKDLR